MTAVLRNRRLALLAVCCAAVVGLAAGCGGGSSSGVPKGDVALVDGQPIKEAQLNTLLAQYNESLVVAKQAVPKKGSAQYKSILQRLVQYLVQKTEFEQQAKKLGVSVTPKEIDAGVKKFVDQYFAGSQKKFLAAMKKQHATLDQVRENVAFTTLQNNLVKKLTGADKVSDPEAIAYYNKNIAQYKKAASRSLEHILVKTKKLADSIYTQLQGGASFAKLAKKYSIDKGSAVNGGKLGVQFENQLVAPFAKVGFALKTGVISKPVKSQFGWHVIEALGPVIPATKSAFSKEKAAIVQQLLQAKKSDTMSTWQNTVVKFYSTRVKYASAYAPAAQTTAPAPTSLLPTTTVPTG
jgi:parvulin-like peptidyl-prolyl isomerase